MRVIRLLLTAALLCLGAASALAQGPATIELELDEGELIRLPQPATAVFVANPGIADIQVMSPSLVYVFAKRAGDTTLFAIDEQDRVLVDRRVVVSHDLTSLRQALADLLPGVPIEPQSVDGGIVLTGTVSDAAAAEDARRLAARYVGDGEVINRIAIDAPNQVYLRVRVAEVSRSIDKQFGINWEALGDIGNFTFGLAQGADIVVEDGTILRVGEGSTLVAGFNTSSVDINGIIDALEEEGLVTILAEPNLTAKSGETASFLAGGEFPVPVSRDEDGLVIEFKEFGVRLDFTPTLTGDGRINLRVRPEVSQLSSVGAIVIDGLQIPALSTRRAETTVELGSGQSFAIAGLLQNNVNETISQFPVLGDVPVLGALFRSSRFQRDESELVIIVTPYTVEPVSDDRLALPTDRIMPANDIDRLLFGRLTEEPAAGHDLAGPVGFILN